MLGDRLQLGLGFAAQPLVDDHVAQHRRHVIARFPIRQALGPQQRIALVVNRVPAIDRERPGVVGGDDLEQLAPGGALAADLLDIALPIFEVGRGVGEEAEPDPARPRQVARGPRAHLHQPDRACRRHHRRAEIAFLPGMGMAERGVDPPPPARRPAHRRKPYRRIDRRPARAIVREPILRPRKAQRPRQQREVAMLGLGAGAGLLAEHRISQSALADREQFARADRVGA